MFHLMETLRFWQFEEVAMQSTARHVSHDPSVGVFNYAWNYWKKKNEWNAIPKNLMERLKYFGI